MVLGTGSRALAAGSMMADGGDSSSQDRAPLGVAGIHRDEPQAPSVLVVRSGQLRGFLGGSWVCRVADLADAGPAIVEAVAFVADLPEDAIHVTVRERRRTAPAQS